MNNKNLMALFGLKYNPFSPSVPTEYLWNPPGVEPFLGRVESLVSQGGFALVSGEPGMGKSKVLQLLAERLEQQADITVGVMQHPQSKLGDFYRELGDLYGVRLSPANRYGGFKSLRAQWRDHVKSTLMRPVLLIDEAQEMATDCLVELRILTSAHFDSECLLTTVLCGDSRLRDRFRSRDLLPLESRIRTRFVLDPYTQDELADFLHHGMAQAGATELMTPELKRALCEHAGGNPRTLTIMASELLDAAAERDLAVMDDELFFDVYAKSVRTPRKKSRRKR